MRWVLVAALVGCSLGQSEHVTRCEAGGDDAGLACLHAGRQALNGELTAQDPKAARRFFDRGCELGHGDACLAMAVALGEGKFGPPDPRAREQWFAKACQKSSRGGCIDFAKALEERGEDKSALAARQRACQLGDDASCNRVDELTKP